MLTAIREAAEAIARQVGELLKDYAARPVHRAEYKSSAVDVTTEADKAAEGHIVAAIQAAFPDHHIHGEEGGGYGPPAEGAPYRWYVDPIDGTSSFAHGYPGYSTSLSVVDQGGEAAVGVIYDPTRDECFSVVRGRGATLNGRAIRVSQTADLIRALLSTGYPYDRRPPDNNTAEWAAFVQRAQDVRRLGSAALDLAYVACGRLDGFWELRLNPWDVVAGALMVREAGGVATNYAGATEPVNRGGDIIASNGLIHQAMIAVIAEARATFMA
jgi:myo-inositol-1(or 4)-monophosphatase